jgi:hypothetical protein
MIPDVRSSVTPILTSTRSAMTRGASYPWSPARVKPPLYTDSTSPRSSASEKKALAGPIAARYRDRTRKNCCDDDPLKGDMIGPSPRWPHGYAHYFRTRAKMESAGLIPCCHDIGKYVQ